MKQINPLHLLILLTVLLVAMLFALEKKKSELVEVKSEIVKTTQIADDLVSLKKSWGNKKLTKAKLLKLLKNSTVANAGVEYDVSSSKVVINAESMKSKEFSYFMNKVFNMALNITSLKVRSLDKHHVSLHMEVSL